MTGSSQSPIRILLIEDNGGDVRLLRELLKPYGPARFEVTDRSGAKLDDADVERVRELIRGGVSVRSRRLGRRLVVRSR